MDIPLANRLKKRLHVETAGLQDELMDIVYQLEPNAVLHGGTTIWRCYGGNRFSEDLDFYFTPQDHFKEQFETIISERKLTLSKYKQTSNLIFSKVSNGSVEVRLEVNYGTQTPKAVLRPYEKVNGTFMDILTLSAEQLLLEKIKAYSSRKLVRDIYDIFHLSKYVENPKQFSTEMRTFLSSFEAPVDEENLKVLVYSGVIPSLNQMLQTIRARFL